MTSSAPTPAVICFGAFELDASSGELRKAGVSLKLHPQPFRLLLLLVERAGQTVTRNEIQRCLWSDSTFVDYERGINFCINQIRGALGDDAERPRYVETLPRRGYRFIAPVFAGSSNGSAPSTDIPAPDRSPGIVPENGDALGTAADAGDSKSTEFRPIGRLAYGAAAVAILLLALAGGLRWLTHSRPVSNAPLSETQLTRNAPESRNLGGTISPDGKHVAFIDMKGLHLLAIDTGELHDITLPQEIVGKLWDVQWFPDGENLLLRTATAGEGNWLWRVSVFGGTPRKMRERAWPAAISPENSSVAFVSGDLNQLWVMDANGDNAKKILTTDGLFTNVTWSPVGGRLAFVRSSNVRTGQTTSSIETVSLAGGSPSVVFSDDRIGREALCWMHDGRLIFSRNEPREVEAGNLWQLQTDPRTGKPNGEPAKITNWFGIAPLQISTSTDGKRLVVDKLQNRNDVYVGDLNGAGTRLDSPRRLTFSESRDVPSAWTRDGKGVLFSSNRTGRMQIFTQEVGRDSAHPLIQGADEQVGAQQSPDGRWTLYYSTEYPESGAPPTTRLMRLATDGAAPEKILEAQGVPGPTTFVFDCPSAPSSSCVIGRFDQGRLVFYALDPIRGQGQELTKTRFEEANAADWAISADGMRIAIVNATQQGKQLAVLGLKNNAERDVPLSPEWAVYSLCWANSGDALYAAVAAPHYQIVRIGMDGKASVLLDRARDTWLSDVAVSPDGTHVAFNQQTFEANLWLLENF